MRLLNFSPGGSPLHAPIRVATFCEDPQRDLSVLWDETAAAQLIGGAWSRRSLVQKSGLAVLALFVSKLFFVDLAALPTLGRIGLFLGMGAGFIAISYLLPGLGKVAGAES